MTISQAIRNESFETFKTIMGSRQKELFDLLKHEPLTAWELAEKTGRMIHALRPRLTELMKLGFIKAAGEKWHQETLRNETVWAISETFEFDEQGQGKLL